jgi:methylamine dehydrogenase accessory protein MauD
MEILVISNILLWILVMCLAAVVFALTRQIGVLYERVAPAGALAINQQLKVGDEAPEIAVNALQGDVNTIGGLPDNKHSKLLFFLSPDCPVCKTLLPVIRSSRQAESDWLDVLLMSDGEEQDHQGFIKKYKLDSFDYILSGEVGISYGVAKLPYAVLIDEQGKIASLGIVNSREHLDSLFEAKELKIASIQDYVKKHNQNKEVS